jgi:hypothetical protein
VSIDTAELEAAKHSLRSCEQRVKQLESSLSATTAKNGELKRQETAMLLGQVNVAPNTAFRLPPG